MASLVAKKKGNKLYYYVVESARVDGKPRVVHQAYLGSAEKVAALVKDRTAPVPLSAAMRDFGLPGPMACRPADWRLFATGVTLAAAPLRPLAYLRNGDQGQALLRAALGEDPNLQKTETGW